MPALDLGLSCQELHAVMTANTLWRANLWTGVLSPCRLLAGILMYSSLVPAYMSGGKDRPSSLCTWYHGT